MFDPFASATLNPGPGFRIRRLARPWRDDTVVERYRTYDPADISDQCNRMYTMSGEIKNLVNDGKLVGRACTVKTFPGDNLMIHKALDIANPGEVLVIDTGGSTTSAVLGDMIATKAKHRGLAGFVVDGLIRDHVGLREVGLPVFARGVTAAGPLHRGPGEINFPVCCGGVVVNPRDIVVADTTGIAVVEEGSAENIVKRLEQRHQSAEVYAAAVRRGDFSNSWVDRTLEFSGCPVIDD
jgi:RraA family protein